MAKRKRGNAEGSIYQTPDGRWRAAVLLVCGLGLLVYGALGFNISKGLNPGEPLGCYYPQEAQLQASIGAALAAAGWLLRPKGTTSA